MTVKQHTIRMQHELYDYFSMRAIASSRSLNKEIETVLKEARDRSLAVDRAIIEKVESSKTP